MELVAALGLSGLTVMGILVVWLRIERGQKERLSQQVDILKQQAEVAQDEATLYRDLYATLQKVHSRQREENRNVEEEIRNSKPAVFGTDWVYQGRGAVQGNTPESPKPAEADGDS